LTAISLLPLSEKPLIEEKSTWLKNSKTNQLCLLVETYLEYKQQLNLIPDLYLTPKEDKRAIEYLFKALENDGSERAEKLFFQLNMIAIQNTTDQSGGVILLPLNEDKTETFNFAKLCSAIMGFSYKGTESDRALITRPLNFYNDFEELYKLAVIDSNSNELAIKLAAAEQGRKAPKELVTLLRAASIATNEKAYQKTKSISSLESLEGILDKDYIESFRKILSVDAQRSTFPP
jgi:hypothetical protein